MASEGMKHLGQLMLAIGIALLTGCAAVGPSYQGPPEMALSEQWHHSANQPTQSAEDLAHWWEQLGDPHLNSLIVRAQQNSRTLRMALARLDESRAQAGIAAAQRYPEVTATGSAIRQETSSNVFGLPGRTQTFETIGASAGWELDLFGRVRRLNEAAGARYEATVEDYRDVLVVLNAEVARAYVEVRTLQKRLAFAHENVSNQRETRDIVQARYQAELVSLLDVKQAEQNLNGSESNIPLLEAARARAVNRLAVLLGQAPGSLNAELANSQPIPSLPERIGVAIPRNILRQRPDIRRAERQLAAQTAQIGVVTADLYPRLSLSGAFGFSTTSGGLLESASKLWSFGPDLVWNIFNAGATRKRIRIEHARAEQARFHYEQTVLSAFEDVEAGLISFGQERKRLHSLSESVAAARSTVEIAHAQYQNGLANFQRVLDAERILFAEEDRLADSEGALVRYLVGIYRAMGGGWSHTSSDTHEQ